MASELPTSPPIPHDLLYNCQNEDGALLFTIDTHPSCSLLATGDIQGVISIFSYSPGTNCNCLRTFTHPSSGSCRAVKFSKTGNRVFSGSEVNGGVYASDVETGQLLHCIQAAHGSSLYSVHVISERLLATGDESGVIKLWDTSTWKEVCALRENRDFISNMATNEDQTTLLATSGDGSLVAVDLRARRVEGKSDHCESELLSLAVVKRGRKVVCGDGEGALMIYNWGLWEDITDRYPTRPHSIDSMVCISDSVVCTGSMDGAIRSVQVLPTQVLGTVGRHSTGLPIDHLCLSHDHAYLVSSNQEGVRFWAMESVPMVKAGGEAEGGEGKGRRRKGRKRKRKQREEEERVEAGTSSDNFFADL